MGIPVSFTSYSMDDELLRASSGFLVRRGEMVPLYTVTDVHLRQTIGQRLFGVGNVVVISGDSTAPRLELESVRDPQEVQTLIYSAAEDAKMRRKQIQINRGDKGGRENNAGDRGHDTQRAVRDDPLDTSAW